MLSKSEVLERLGQVISNRSNIQKVPGKIEINCAGAQLLDYFNKKFTELVNNLLKVQPQTQEDPVESSKRSLLEASIIDNKTHNAQQTHEEAGKENVQESFKSIHDVKLIESIYEPISHSTIERSPRTSKSENIDSSGMMDSSGFRYILKFENGKPQFVAVPVTSLNSETGNKDS